MPPARLAVFCFVLFSQFHKLKTVVNYQEQTKNRNLLFNGSFKIVNHGRQRGGMSSQMSKTQSSKGKMPELRPKGIRQVHTLVCYFRTALKS
jgi:hypothetical protein